MQRADARRRSSEVAKQTMQGAGMLAADVVAPLAMASMPADAVGSFATVGARRGDAAHEEEG